MSTLQIFGPKHVYRKLSNPEEVYVEFDCESDMIHATKHDIYIKDYKVTGTINGVTWNERQAFINSKAQSRHEFFRHKRHMVQHNFNNNPPPNGSPPTSRDRTVKISVATGANAIPLPLTLHRNFATGCETEPGDHNQEENMEWNPWC